MNGVDAGPEVTPPLELRRLVDQAMVEWRRHFRRAFGPVAAPLALLAALVPVAQASLMGSFLTQRAPDPLRALPGLAAFVLLLLAFLLVSAAAFGALYVAAVDGVGGREVDMRRAWLTILRPRVFGTFVLAGVCTVAGLVLCCLPGFYVGLLLSLTVPAMIDEGVYGTSALARSAQLMRHNPGGELSRHPMLKAFLVSFVGLLLSYALSFAIQLPAAVLQQVWMMRMVHEGSRPDPALLMQKLLWLQVPSQVLGMLVQVAVYLYVFLAFALLFADLRRRREGTDIDLALGGLVGGGEPTQ